MNVPALQFDAFGADLAGGTGAAAGELGDLPETALFTRMLAQLPGTEDYHRQLLARKAIFLERWPTLAAWGALPMATRVGTHKGPTAGGGGSDARLSYANRHYLVFLALTGRCGFDYPWILSAGAFRGLWRIADALGLPLRTDVATLLAGAGDTGWSASTCQAGLPWTVARLALHRGDPRCAFITAAQLAELEAAALAAPIRPGRKQRSIVHRCAYPRLTHALLFQAGLIAKEGRTIHANTDVRLVGSAAIRITLRALPERRASGSPTAPPAASGTRCGCSPPGSPQPGPRSRASPSWTGPRPKNSSPGWSITPSPRPAAPTRPAPAEGSSCPSPSSSATPPCGGGMTFPALR